MPVVFWSQSRCKIIEINFFFYRFRTFKFRDRYHLKGGVGQGCFLSLIINYLILQIHFHSLY